MATTIQIKRSSTASAVPLAGDLEVGELAVNLADKRLFTKKSDGTVVELSTNPTDIDIATLRIDGVEVTASAAEINALDGSTASTADLNKLAAVTATSTELNVLDGFTGSTAELNILDGVTATTAELNILDGATVTTSELNTLDGITATTTELNYTDGVTSNIQTQLDTKAPIASPTFTGTTTIPTVDINGGDIDGVQIGTVSPNAGVFSTLNTNSSFEAPNIDDNGTKVDLKNGGTTKLATTSTGVDVTGTVTADGLTVDGDATVSKTGGTTFILENSAVTPYTGTELQGSIVFKNYDTSGDGDHIGARIDSYVVDSVGSGNLQFTTGRSDFNLAKRLEINEDGDVSFYEDTGTTAKMVWDASAESLNLGGTATTNTAGFSQNLALKDLYPSITLEDTGSGTAKYTIGATTGALGVWDSSASAYRMFIDSSGNVGIGTASPTGKLDIVGGRLYIDSTDDYAIRFEKNSVVGGYIGAPSSSVMAFYNSAGAEKARIDSSGNLLVGTTSGTNSKKLSVVGDSSTSIAYIEQTTGSSSNDSVPALTLNRQTRDGAILNFEKSGSTVGSIGTQGGRLTIGDAGVGVRFADDFDNIQPFSVTTNAIRDNAIDLGSGAGRFKDLYLSGGVYLGGTGSANKLDDYEEGIWTPTASRFSGGAISATYATRSGTYVRVGNVVTIGFQFSITSISSQGSSLTRITGLPFYPSDAYFYNGVVGDNTTPSGNPPTRLTAHSDGSLYFRDGQNNTLNISTDWTTGQLSGSVTYVIA